MAVLDPPPGNRTGPGHAGDAPADSYEWTKGPSGFGPRLLLTWLTGPDPLAGIA